MKMFVIAGTLVGALAVGGNAVAQSSTPAAQQPTAGATKQTATKPAGATAEQPAGQTADKPAAKQTAKKKSAAKESGDSAAGTHTAPKTQPNTTTDATAPGPMVLGTVHIPGGLKADGKELPAGTYQVRLTADEAKPDAKGSQQQLERWVEFVKGGEVKGREIASILPSAEKHLVVKSTPPGPGSSRVETLRGGEFVRVWINKGGDSYLIHLVKS